MSKSTETPPVSDLGPLPMAEIQSAFDAWSEPITGNRADVMMSSHGRAFMAGWDAALKHKEEI